MFIECEEFIWFNVNKFRFVIIKTNNNDDFCCILYSCCYVKNNSFYCMYIYTFEHKFHINISNSVPDGCLSNNIFVFKN